MSSSPSRGAARLLRGARRPALAPAPLTPVPRPPAPARRRRAAAAPARGVERPGLDARRRHRPRASPSPGRRRAATTRITWPDLDQVRVVEVVPAHQVFPVLAGVEADPDQRVAGLDGVVAGLAAVASAAARLGRLGSGRRRRSRPGWRRRRSRAASAMRSSTGARFGVLRRKPAERAPAATAGHESQRRRGAGASITRIGSVVDASSSANEAGF